MIKQNSQIFVKYNNGLESKIDNALNEYYKSFQINDYKNENGIGNTILNQPILDYINLDQNCGIFPEDCIYLEWDDNFPFSHPAIDITKSIRKRIMYQVIKHCHLKGYAPTEFPEDMLKIKRFFGLDQHIGYHINSPQYCSRPEKYGVDCKYCRDPGVYHKCLVTRYIRDFARSIFVPECIVELIALFFDINSKRLPDIKNRNNYLLSYWRKHIPFRRYISDKKFGAIYMNIYQDGKVYFSDSLKSYEFCPERKVQKLNLEQIESLIYLI